MAPYEDYTLLIYLLTVNRCILMFLIVTRKPFSGLKYFACFSLFSAFYSFVNY